MSFPMITWNHQGSCTCGFPGVLWPQPRLCPLYFTVPSTPRLLLLMAGQVCSTTAHLSPSASPCVEGPQPSRAAASHMCRSSIDEKWQKQVLKVEVLAYCSGCIKNHSQIPHEEFYTPSTCDTRETEKQTWDNHTETCNHNRSLGRRMQGKLLSQTGWWIVSSADRQTARGTYFYKNLTERTPDIQACSLLTLISRADSALSASLCKRVSYSMCSC